MITIVKGEDWIGVYKDNDLIYQNHSISATYLLKILGIEHKIIFADDQFMELGGAPQCLHDVVPDKNT